jgi:hypothetical protein
MSFHAVPPSDLELLEDGLFSTHCHDDGPIPFTDVQLQMHNLLPCPKHKSAASDGYDNIWTQDACLKMGMAIAILPRLFVPIITAGRYQLAEDLRKIIPQSRLEFYRAYSCSAPDGKDMGDTCLNVGIVHD